jgi:SAM-dependent methyltransferase
MTASETATGLSISMPARSDGGDQDSEWCWVKLAGQPPRRIRFHDYGAIYAIPGLYERLFHDELKCMSPVTVCGLIADVMAQTDRDPNSLRVLDLGAGSGMVGEQLQQLGACHLAGVDICEEAAVAAERDRPGVYDTYVVADLCHPEPDVDRVLRESDFNCLTSVSALGFGDIPPRAFANSVNYVDTGGLIAFTLRDRFLEEADKSGYRKLIDRMIDESVMEPLARWRFRHRFSSSGEALHYVAVVAEKRADVPLDWV